MKISCGENKRKVLETKKNH